MSEPQELIQIAKHDLVGIVAELFAEGHRLVQIGCSTLTDAYELNYSFDKEYRFRNLRITVTPGEEIPSISVIYPGAFLYENEIHDLFGVSIRNISVDYRGTLYRTAIRTPFSIGNVKLPEPPKQKVEPGGDSPVSAREPAGMPGQQKDQQG